MRGIVGMTSVCPPERGFGRDFLMEAGPRDEAEQSLEEIYRDLAALLQRIAIQRFQIPSDDAETLVHDVFATYLTQRPNVRTVRGYLIGGICNASRRYWRERRLADGMFTPLDEERGSATDFVDRVSIHVALGATLARLGSRCRETLRRYYLEGQTTHEIAAAMKTSTSNVLKILHDCRKAAREVYLSITRAKE
jgi:RNA polymerase sigma factor (sigma-70 family)